MLKKTCLKTLAHCNPSVWRWKDRMGTWSGCVHATDRRTCTDRIRLSDTRHLSLEVRKRIEDVEGSREAWANSHRCNRSNNFRNTIDRSLCNVSCGPWCQRLSYRTNSRAFWLLFCLIFKKSPWTAINSNTVSIDRNIEKPDIHVLLSAPTGGTPM